MTLRRAAIKRVGFSEPSERSLIEGAARDLTRFNSTFKIKKPRIPKEQIICGLHWPLKWIPEEPLKGYVKGRDTCFRWMVEELLDLNGWKFIHITDSRMMDAGYPDLACWREREMYLELKVRDQFGTANQASAVQKAFHSTLIKAGCEVYVITYPDDFEKLKLLVAR